MKSQIYTFLLVLFFGLAGFGYGQTGIGTTTPDPSAQLDVTSTDKGILIPRMTEAQRNDIDTPAEGLMIYQTNVMKGFYYYNGSVWVPISDGGGTIIPYASGVPVVLTTLSDGSPGTVAVIAFGNSVSGISNTGGTIDITSIPNMTFSVPRDGVISSLSAFLSTTAAVILSGTSLTVTAQLYSSTTLDNIFSPISGASVNLSPPLTGIISLGSISSGITENLNIAVTAGTRLMLVFSVGVTEGMEIPTNISGYASGGVAFN